MQRLSHFDVYSNFEVDNACSKSAPVGEGQNFHTCCWLNTVIMELRERGQQKLLNQLKHKMKQRNISFELKDLPLLYQSFYSYYFYTLLDSNNSVSFWCLFSLCCTKQKNC